MTWARVDDGLHDHPKFVGLSLASVGLWTLCLSYASKRRDPAVPRELPRRFGASAAHVAALVNAGLWEATEGGWTIHDWSHYTTDGTQQRKAANARWRNADASPPHPPRTPTAMHSVSPRDGSPVPDPVPVPVERSSERSSARGAVIDHPAVQAYLAAAEAEGLPPAVLLRNVGQVEAEARELIEQGVDPGDVVNAAADLGRRGGNPKLLHADVERLLRQRGNSITAQAARTVARLEAAGG